VKIAMVTLFNPFERMRGGIESAVYHQSTAFARLKHEIWILTMGNVQKDTIMNIEGVNVWVLPDRKIDNKFLRTLLFIKKGKAVVEKIEREFEIDVFNGQAGYSGPLSFANLKNARRVLTVHTIDGENIATIRDCWRVGRYTEFLSEVLQYPILKVWRSFFFWRADALIFVSELALREFRTFYPHLKGKPCLVIENGFPQLSCTAGVSAGEKNYDFIYIGRIDKIKGVDLIIKAANRLKRECSFKIAVVGDGPWKVDMQKLATRLSVDDNFRFFGHLDHSSALEILRASRCLILPSFYESDPLVVKECSALRKPMICSDISSLKQKISNFKNGLTFRCGNYEDLAKTMRAVLSSDRDGNMEQKTASENPHVSDICSWDEVAENYTKALKSLISG
jgi:glycosyltransferase involved in cell wall biosynthesis